MEVHILSNRGYCEYILGLNKDNKNIYTCGDKDDTHDYSTISDKIYEASMSKEEFINECDNFTNAYISEYCKKKKPSYTHDTLLFLSLQYFCDSTHLLGKYKKNISSEMKRLINDMYDSLNTQYNDFNKNNRVNYDDIFSLVTKILIIRNNVSFCELENKAQLELINSNVTLGLLYACDLDDTGRFNHKFDKSQKLDNRLEKIGYAMINHKAATGVTALGAFAAAFFIPGALSLILAAGLKFDYDIMIKKNRYVKEYAYYMYFTAVLLATYTRNIEIQGESGYGW